MKTTRLVILIAVMAALGIGAAVVVDAIMDRAPVASPACGSDADPGAVARCEDTARAIANGMAKGQAADRAEAAFNASRGRSGGWSSPRLLLGAGLLLLAIAGAMLIWRRPRD